MRTPANIAGHPIHPMLVPLPIGLWVFSLVCDIGSAFGGDPGSWKLVALYTMIGGIVGALLAAVFGLIDLLSLPAGNIRKTALLHMVVNLTVVALFVVNAWLRLRDGALGGASPGLVWLSVIAVGLLLISGWLGGKMVFTQGVAVDIDETRR